jgi:hypothetical protein
MIKSCLHAILLFPVAALLLQGCSYYKLAKPEPQNASIDLAQAVHSNATKFSYSLRVYPTGPAEKALLDSLSAYGIQDVIKSEKLEQDRVNIIAYNFDAKPNKTDRYVGLPWSLISLGTLFLVPYFNEETRPVEIHVIIPGREYNKQLKIIRTEYVIASRTWLPFLFVSNDKLREDVHYGWTKPEKFDYLAWRRIFDGVLRELVRENSAKKDMRNIL